jgi:hypothetical protein
MDWMDKGARVLFDQGHNGCSIDIARTRLSQAGNQSQLISFTESGLPQPLSYGRTQDSCRTQDSLPGTILS